MKTYKSFMQQFIIYTYILFIMLIILIAGCTSTKETKESADNRQSSFMDISDPSPSETGIQAGRELFFSVGCSACHKVNGNGGIVGPDLSNEGNMKHSRSWLTTQIRDPKSHDPQTVMPAYSYLPDANVAALVDYLEQLITDKEGGNISDRVVFESDKQKDQTVYAVSSSVAMGGKMWAQKCGQCHNLRDPSEYSDSQWEVAIFHMRLLVPLTGDEQRKILEFLEASN
jgi:mono/diheme cytochrome c family protein